MIFSKIFSCRDHYTNSCVLFNLGCKTELTLRCYFQTNISVWKSTLPWTSIDHPQIGGAYILRLCARNFNLLVCVQSSSEWRTTCNNWICFYQVGWLRLPDTRSWRQSSTENYTFRLYVYMENLNKNIVCRFYLQLWGRLPQNLHRFCHRFFEKNRVRMMSI